MGPPWLGNVWINAPVPVSQTLTAPLTPPPASTRPAASKATLAISLRCHSKGLRRRSKVRTNLPSIVSQSATVPSRPPPASCRSVGSNATHLIARWFHSKARISPTPGGALAGRDLPLLLGIAVPLALCREHPAAEANG